MRVLNPVVGPAADLLFLLIADSVITASYERSRDMEFPHRHGPADGANGRAQDRCERHLAQDRNDFSAPFNVAHAPDQPLKLNSRNYH